MGAEPSWRPDPVSPQIERWWDGTHWTDHIRPAPVAAEGPQPLSRKDARDAARAANRRSRQEGRPSRVIAIATQTTLAVAALGSGVSMVGLMLSYNNVSIGIARGTQDVSLWQAAADTLGNGLYLYLLLLALGGVLTATWFAVRLSDRRVNRIIVRRPASTTLISAFVPIIQLWWPAQGMKDLWHASRPELSRSGLKKRLPVPASIFLWWGFMLASTIAPASVVALTIYKVKVDLPPTVSQMSINTVAAQQSALALLIGAMAFTFGFALLSILSLMTVIAQVERHLAMPDAPEGQEFRHLAAG